MTVRNAIYGYQRSIATLLRINERQPIMVDLGTPALAVTNYYVTTTAMKVGAYTLAHTAPSSGGARNVTCTVTKVTQNDTMGTVLVTGTDIDGATITETLTPNNGDTSSGLTSGTKAFAGITSIVGAGWVTGGNDDTIVFGFGSLIGLPKAATAAKDILTTTLAGAAVTVVAAADGTHAGSTVDLSSGTYNGSKQALALFVPADNTVLTATGALTLLTTSALGFACDIEEFGFRVGGALHGTGGTQPFTLADGSGNVIATLTVPLATASTRGATISTTTMVAAYSHIPPDGNLVLARKTGGTAFLSGTGEFYVRYRQKPQTAV